MSSNQKPLRLLSFDGGGTRGYSGLTMLRELIHRADFLSEVGQDSSPRDYFDMIAGWGTGGVSAVLVGRLALNPRTAMKTYQEIMKLAFPKEITFQKDKIAGIKAYVETLLVRLGFPKDTRMRDDNNPPGDCKVLMYIAPLAHMDYPAPVYSYRGYSFNSLNPTISEAILVSLASPAELGPIHLGDDDEGGLYTNVGSTGHNPTKLLLREVQGIFGKEANIGSIISFGSGKPATGISFPLSAYPSPQFPSSQASSTSQDHRSPPVSSDSNSGLLDTLEQLLISGEATHEDLEGINENLNVYFRFNVEQYVGTVPIHDWEQPSDIINMTQKFLLRQDIRRKFESAVDSIRNPTPKAEIRLITSPGSRQPSIDHAVVSTYRIVSVAERAPLRSIQ